MELESLNSIVNEGSETLDREVNLALQTFQEGNLGSLEAPDFELVLLDHV